MKYQKAVFSLFAILSIFALLSTNLAFASNNKTINIYFFHGEGCPHCAKEKLFLEKQSRDENINIRVFPFEVYHDKESVELLKRVAEKLQISTSGVPLTIIGEETVFGYSNDETTGKNILKLIEQHQDGEYNDPVFELLSEEQKEKTIADLDADSPEPETMTENEENNNDSEKDSKEEQEENIIHLPIFGDVNTANLSLPVLTVAIGAVDGFNPCAMWALLFLITLLFGMKNRKRMWALGIAFIAASAVVYFVFLAAWFNIFQFLGVIQWIRIIIGIIAIASGVFHLKNYFKKEQTCEVGTTKQKTYITDKMKQFVQEKKFILALGGIVLVAAAVNLVELVCSAGLPAIYTQILSLSELSTFKYYMYLLLYILVFMIDDIIIFAIAMLTMKLTGISGKYTKIANLIGGILILILGILLLVKPEWLMFG